MEERRSPAPGPSLASGESASQTEKRQEEKAETQG